MADSKKAAAAAAALKNRIVAHGEEQPEQLLANPLNFRRHPGSQLDALRGSLRELGWVKAILVNKTTGHVIDGHARVEEAMRQGLPTVPVDYVELTEAEERLALAVLDTITALAVTDDDALSSLAESVETDDEALQKLLSDLTKGPESEPLDDDAALEEQRNLASTYSEQFGVVVTCSSEGHQQETYERLRAEGYTCKVVTT